MTRWPTPGGFLDRMGLPPEEIEARSRGVARQAAAGYWDGLELELAASLVYAAGDPGLVDLIEISGDPIGHARSAAGPILVDVKMVAAGIRARPHLVAVSMPGASELAARGGTTRAAAGAQLAWEQLETVGLVAIGNAPTALLAVLDLAAAGSPPACVIATCPGFHIAAEAKAALAASGLPHVLVSGTRGGSGLAAAAVNSILVGEG